MNTPNLPQSLRVTVAKMPHALVVVLIIVFAAGQVPYGYLYCSLMKRALDPEMRRCCQGRHSSGGVSVVSAARLQIMHVEKKTTEGSERLPDVRATITPGVPASMAFPAASPFPLMYRPANPPLPDIVLEQRNLRI
jgi:hypothetical protein